MLELPEILNFPPKLLPIITEFNNYRYFLIEGGRGSAKSQSVARLLSYLAEAKENLSIVCGREVQCRIEESVHAIISELIQDYELNFTIQDKRIFHNKSNSEFAFRGFIDRGITNTRGIEGVDILWVDEAQQLSKKTVDDLIPTVIRNEKAKLFFTMNRYLMDDAIYEYLAGHPECLHIKINYFDNSFCPLSMKNEAENCRKKSERDYRHIWLGEPLATADDLLFNYEKLHHSYDVEPFGELFGRQRIMGIDFAAQGNDQCVASILDRVSNQHWLLSEQIAWDESDAMVSVGKIINLVGQYKPDIAILDVGGMGHVVYNRLIEVGIDIKRFDGASTAGVDSVHYVNARAEGYYILKDWFDNSFLKIDKKHQDVIKELEKIRMKFRSDGRRILESKVDMRKHNNYSPDHADSLMMAVYGAVKFLGRSNSAMESATTIRRINNSKRKR